MKIMYSYRQKKLREEIVNGVNMNKYKIYKIIINVLFTIAIIVICILDAIEVKGFHYIFWLSIAFIAYITSMYHIERNEKSNKGDDDE